MCSTQTLQARGRVYTGVHVGGSPAQSSGLACGFEPQPEAPPEGGRPLTRAWSLGTGPQTPEPSTEEPGSPGGAEAQAEALEAGDPCTPTSDGQVPVGCPATL